MKNFIGFLAHTSFLVPDYIDARKKKLGQKLNANFSWQTHTSHFGHFSKVPTSKCGATVNIFSMGFWPIITSTSTFQKNYFSHFTQSEPSLIQNLMCRITTVAMPNKSSHLIRVSLLEKCAIKKPGRPPPIVLSKCRLLKKYFICNQSAFL